MAKSKVKEFIIDTTPRRVKDKEHTLYNFPCETDLGGLITYLNGLVDQHGSDANIVFDHTAEDYWGQSTLEVTVTPFRDETPVEIEKRIAKAKKNAERAVVQRIKNKEKEEKLKKKQEKEEVNLLKKLQAKYKGYNFENINPEG